MPVTVSSSQVQKGTDWYPSSLVLHRLVATCTIYFTSWGRLTLTTNLRNRTLPWKAACLETLLEKHPFSTLHLLQPTSFGFKKLYKPSREKTTCCWVWERGSNWRYQLLSDKSLVWKFTCTCIYVKRVRCWAQCHREMDSLSPFCKRLNNLRLEDLCDGSLSSYVACELRASNCTKKISVLS